MKHLRLDPDSLHVVSFDPTPAVSFQLAASDPVTDPGTGPNTWEDTCINMCPTDDTCTMLGCTRTD